MKIVLLGAPGSGKGTHAQRLTKELNIPQISTGDIFRKNLKEETPLGLQVKEIMAKGQLVPDAITVAIVKDRLAQDDCANGYILDGFPRSLVQAEELDKFEDVQFAVNIDVDKQAVIDRLSGRRFCPDCNGTYHVSTLNGQDKCPNCGGTLIARQDDSEQTVRDRLDVYEKTTMPLIDYYARQGKLVNVDGNGTIEEVYNRVLRAIGK